MYADLLFPHVELDARLANTRAHLATGLVVSLAFVVHQRRLRGLIFLQNGPAALKHH